MKNYSRHIFIIILFIIFLFFSASNTFAYDKEVVCADSDYSGFSGALFLEEDIKPGDSVNKTLSIENNRNENLSITLSSEKLSGTDDILSEIITVIIYDGGTILFSGTFEEFLGKSINMGNISKNQTKVYEINTNFPYDSGNVYQNKRVNISLTLQIKGEESGSEEVLSTSTSASSVPDIKMLKRKIL